MPERGDDLLLNRREKLQRLRQRGIDPFPPRCHRTHSIRQARAFFEAEEHKANESVRTEEVAIVGRMMALRGMGRASFLDILDGTGRIQVHVRRDLLGDNYELLHDMDLGDFVAVEGPLFRTRTGEITVEALRLAVLAKALRPLPEKWHGLTDPETRYRQRYLDLIASPDIRESFEVKAHIIAKVREFLNGRGFVEVETPILVPVAAGAMARPFTTHHNELDQDLFLRIALELYLKRLIVGGFDKVYEIGRVFRNEGVDQDHNPEFILLESYEAYADYNDVMHMVEEMVSSVATEVLGSVRIQFSGNTIDLTPPWRRLSLRDAILQESGVDINNHHDAASLAAKLQALGIEATHKESRGRLVDKLLSARVEPKLIQPTFLLDYPEEMSPLAKPKLGSPGYVERFEAFVGGMELANSYTEMNDPDLQRKRLMEQEEMRRTLGDEEVERLDDDFLLALEYGMPPTGGLGMGLDRLAMILMNQRSIRDTLLFPAMRSRT
jgi:lysyl-tRNA synthetase class 2